MPQVIFFHRKCTEFTVVTHVSVITKIDMTDILFFGSLLFKSDVKYSRLENGQQPDAGNNSSGFGKSIKFVAILAVVIVLFTCTTWAFKKPESSKAQAGIHSFR